MDKRRVIPRGQETSCSTWTRDELFHVGKRRVVPRGQETSCSAWTRDELFRVDKRRVVPRGQETDRLTDMKNLMVSFTILGTRLKIGRK